MSEAARVLSTGQAAKRLGLHLRKVQRLIESGELPYLEKLPGPNGRYLLDASVVDMYKRQLDAEKAQASA